MTKLIFIDDIDFEHSPKVRHQINDDVVESYAERYKNKQKLPPIHVFIEKKGAKPILADGAHRCYAKAQCGQKAIDAEVHEGGYKEALLFALLANTTHGLQRTSADKRTCIKLALTEWPSLSNLELSKRCDVDDKTVAEVRKELEAADIIKATATRVTATGKEVPSKRAEPVARKSEQPPPKKVTVVKIVDANGTEIPQAIIKYWNRSDEIKETIGTITSILKKLRQAEDEEDAMYHGVNMSAIVGDLENVRVSLAGAIPYAVCTQCQGHCDIQPKGECRLCGRKGLISKFAWDRLIPAETKEMISKKKK